MSNARNDVYSQLNGNSNDVDDRFTHSLKVEKRLGISLDCFEVLSVDTRMFARKRE